MNKAWIRKHVMLSVAPSLQRIFGRVQTLTFHIHRTLPCSRRCVRLATLPPSCADCLEIWELNFLEYSGHLGPVMGLIYLTLQSELI